MKIFFLVLIPTSVFNFDFYKDRDEKMSPVGASGKYLPRDLQKIFDI